MWVFASKEENRVQFWETSTELFVQVDAWLTGHGPAVGKASMLSAGS